MALLFSGGSLSLPFRRCDSWLTDKPIFIYRGSCGGLSSSLARIIGFIYGLSAAPQG